MSALDSLRRIVRQAVGDYRYERSYGCSVERTHADGSIDVLPNDAAVRGLGLQHIPVALVDPSTRVAPAPGARCLLGFASGDPRQPCILAWEYAQDSATVFLDQGAAAVARKGDLVNVMTSTATPVAGSVSVVVQTPNPSPPPPTLPVRLAGAPFNGYATLPTPAQASIMGGAQKVRA